MNLPSLSNSRIIPNIENKAHCLIQDLGLIDYERAFLIQKETVTQVLKGQSDTLILCEHPSVLTLGRLASEENYLIPRDEIISRGVRILNIDRGGEITLHAPGQLVTYPIFNIQRSGRDLKHFLSKLEQVAIDLLQGFDILARRISGQRGVWVNDKKIASIGIGVKKWISFHGMSINVNVDLNLFRMIRPCGLDVQMTSISQLTNRDVSIQEVKNRVIESFVKNFHH